jgi:hypothetical protein
VIIGAEYWRRTLKGLLNRHVWITYRAGPRTVELGGTINSLTDKHVVLDTKNLTLTEIPYELVKSVEATDDQAV